MRTDRLLRTVAAGLTLGALAACGGRPGGPVRVNIPQGASMRVAADSLARKGVVRWGNLFKVYAWARGGDGRVKPGTYMLRKNQSWSSALNAVRTGRGLVQIVTIPEGFNLGQIEPLLANRLKQPLDSVQAATRDSALIQRLGLSTPTLEGYLFPDTYIFAEGTSARTAVATMVRRFEQIWKPEWTARLDTINLSRNEVMALAAIVEREARLAAERPVVAAVYLNRLKKGMLLQADPTVQYSLGKHVPRIYYKDLAVDSRYNTYRYKGLPPGPIASPGKPSIEAALYPADVPYEYFVAFPDGHHEFRTSLAEHERAKAAARRAWDALDTARNRDTTRRR